MDKAKIKAKIKNHELVCAVIGLGYVGLPLAVEKAKAGYKTIGFDAQQKKVELINAGHNYIGDVVDEDLAKLVERGMLSATDDFSFISEVDFIAICVPTPLDEHQQPDLTFVRKVAEDISKFLKRGTIVVLESTTYPGTTEGLLLEILESGSNLKCGEDFYLGFSPERVDPGNLLYKTKNTPRVVGGVGKDATEVIADLYRNILQGEVYEVSSPAVAEMEKLLENTYRNINIALVNELTMLCRRMNINIWEVIDAAKTKPYGFQAFYPGPGVGGHCIPLDPFYLAWKAREYGFHTSMIEMAGSINDQMPYYCASRCADLLNENEKSVKGAKILVLGAAYKQDINDYRESPALRVMEILRGRGANVSYFDPWVPNYFFKGKQYFSVEKLDAATLNAADLVVIVTAHTNIDYELVQKNSAAILDTKNAMKLVKNRSNIQLL